MELNVTRAAVDFISQCSIDGHYLMFQIPLTFNNCLNKL